MAIKNGGDSLVSIVFIRSICLLWRTKTFNMYSVRYLLIISTLLCILSCNGQPKNSWTGKLFFTYTSDLNVYEFASRKEKTVIRQALQPFVTRTGDIFFVSDAFPKRKYLVRKSNPGFSQFRNVLDMSNENPRFKQQLEDYSVIRGTGISAVLDHISDPRVSPDGKYLSVTVFGYPGQAFAKNCVAIFDMASGELVKKFEDKYYGNWMADGRLVMSGSHKSVSTDGSMYNSAEPGIFIADASLNNVQRIDDGLDDPAPYHATPSPDGKRIAFVLNGHIWVMDVNGKNMKQLTDADNDNIETYPAWSPDGKYIACWSYKTFEKSYFTAIAIVSSTSPKPVALTDKAPVWPKDTKGSRISGGSDQISWVK